MKTIAMLPVRNDAWVLEHALRSLSGFCDAIIVSDQGSTDGSQDICRRFPKVTLLETSTTPGVDRLPQQARWRLLDAARSYDGCNLLWSTDADELTPPDLARAFIERHAADLRPGRVVDCRFYHLWNGTARFRQDLSVYGPRWKPMAYVDDRVADFDRDPARRPLHEPRIAIENDPSPIKEATLPVLHLQFAIWNRNQMKQAWYRCIDRMAGMSAADVNDFYQVTLPLWYVHTEAVPRAWLRELTLPDAAAADREPSWHEAEILKWFDERGIEYFEPLEIWHVPSLRREFERRMGRRPRPDRSYLPPLGARARQLGRRLFNAAKRRLLP